MSFLKLSTGKIVPLTGGLVAIAATRVKSRPGLREETLCLFAFCKSKLVWCVMNLTTLYSASQTNTSLYSLCLFFIWVSIHVFVLPYYKWPTYAAWDFRTTRPSTTFLT